MANIDLCQLYEIIRTILGKDADLADKEIKLCFDNINIEGVNDKYKDSYFHNLKYFNGDIVIETSKDEEVRSISLRPSRIRRELERNYCK